MGYSCYQHMNGMKYYTIIINAGKCKTYKALYNELAGCLTFLPSKFDSRHVDDEIYDLISSENTKFVIEKSNVLFNNNKKMYDLLLENIENYKKYSKDAGYECVVELC